VTGINFNCENYGRKCCLKVKHKLTSAQIFPTVEMVSTGYNPVRVSAPRRIASLPDTNLNM